VALAQQQRPEVKWNNPDGPKVAGINHSSFHSPSMEREVGYNVYLPPGYEQGSDRYPVIYFLHGAGGNENSDAGGFAGLVAGQIAQKKIKPVICVFPNGGMSGYRDNAETKIMVETMIVKELIPLIDKAYRTKANRDGRVLSGFSMGGGGAVRLALKFPELFSAAGSWAGALAMRGPLPSEAGVENLTKTVGKVRLLLIVGEKDFTINGHKPLVENLDQAKFKYTYKVLPGVDHNLGAYHQQTGEEMVRFLTEKF
jgi:endo-1,4-beta-xylanase